MPIKYGKELLKIVYSNDINERYNLSCNLLNNIECRKIYRRNRLYEDNEDDTYKKFTKADKKDIKLKRLSYTDFKFSLSCNIFYNVENPNPDAVIRTIMVKKDLNEINNKVLIYKNTYLEQICSFLIFTRDIEDRKKIYSILSQLICLKKSSYKTFYNNDYKPILTL